MKTIPHSLLAAARSTPDALAIKDGAWRLTYNELLQTVLRLAHLLRARGLEKGDCFAIWAPNCAEWIIAALGGHVLGARLVPLNTRFKGAEAADILRRAKCRILFTATHFLGCDYPAQLAGHDLPHLKEIIPLWDETSAQSALLPFLHQATSALLPDFIDHLSPDDISDILYTSGTTGMPKGVMTTHGQNVAVFDIFTQAIGMRAQDRYLIVNPFFHSFGYKAGWLSCLIRGAAIYPVTVFEPADIARRIAHDKITVMPGAPTIFQSLLAYEDLSEHDISSLRIATTGATTIPVDLIRRMHEELGIDHVFSAYGLTESSGVVTLCQQGDDFETIATTCGRALPETSLRIVDDDGVDVARGDAGELWVRGFNVMQGYFEDEAATAEVLSADGWLKTGDIAVQDADGYIKIIDRKKDMLIVGGFNCYPAEVEKILLTHAGVKNIAVKALPDERLGEVPQAFVVLEDNVELTQAALIAWAREHMANFKVPRRITFVNDLPLNASGKVLKYKL